MVSSSAHIVFFFFQAEDGIRDYKVTGVQTCALPISGWRHARETSRRCGPRALRDEEPWQKQRSKSRAHCRVPVRMIKNMAHRKRFVLNRTERRISMEIPVLIEGHGRAPGSESTFTENVSARGARVLSVRRWEQGDQLVLASRTGEFRSSAR